MEGMVSSEIHVSRVKCQTEIANQTWEIRKKWKMILGFPDGDNSIDGAGTN